MPKVYIVKIPEYRDDNGNWVPKFSPRQASDYGDPVLILGYGPHFINDEIELMRKILANITHDDYLVLSGSPIQMGIATAIAADNLGGKIKFLTWSNRDKKYYKEDVEVWTQ